MGILIDASVYIAYERGKFDLPAEMAARQVKHSRLSVITISELLYGVVQAVDPAIRTKRSIFVEQLIEDFEVLPISLEIARIHAEISAQLDRAGTPIGRHDLLLAATCLQHGLSVVTFNEREFRRVPGLVVENWLSP
jgi:tRNA(fMet)-specific endonuclease VapC